MLTIKAVELVEITDMNFEAGTIQANYELTPDITDLDIKSQQEMLAYIKGIVHEIGKHFQGSEPFIKAFDNENDLNVLMGQLGQYLRISNIPRV